LTCVKLLRAVAERGATVLCTIHQPSSEVFDLFDAIILLKDGRTLYQGPTTAVSDAFARCGFPTPVGVSEPGRVFRPRHVEYAARARVAFLNPGS
jgi:ABC-type multidrug transport system ATPase subunit